MRDINEDLEQEASFWRGLISECPLLTDESMKRMRDALMLVEYKLAQREVEK